jgi:hypothetical protein
MRIALAGLALAAVVLAGCRPEPSPRTPALHEVVREDVVKITEAEWSPPPAKQRAPQWRPVSEGPGCSTIGRPVLARATGW